MRPRYGQRGDAERRTRENAIIQQIAEDYYALGCTANMTARCLNDLKIPAPEGGQWEKIQILRLIEQNQTVMDAARAIREKQLTPYPERREAVTALYREAFLEDDERESPPEDYLTGLDRERIEWRRKAMRQQTETLRRVERRLYKEKLLDRDFVFFDPKSRTDALGRDVQGYQDWNAEDRARWQVGQLGLSGKDTWAKGCDLLLAELTKNTGKDAHALLDKIEGQAAIKGQLRRVVYGMMREILLQRQAYVALMQKAAAPRPDHPNG